MKSLYYAAFTALLLFYQISIQALPSSQSQAEIQHLLNFISTSGCIFIRNDSEYSSDEARKHIEMKFNYVKDKVDSTEKFIQYAATRSSMSGKPYKADCGGVSQATGEWLLAELNRFRENRTAVPAAD